MNNQRDPSNNSGDHGQPFEIIINAEKFKVLQKELSFRELCLLAYPDAVFGDDWAWTVTYSDPHGPEGSLVDNAPPIKIKKGMVFNVGRSDKS